MKSIQSNSNYINIYVNFMHNDMIFFCGLTQAVKHKLQLFLLNHKNSSKKKIINYDLNFVRNSKYFIKI